MLNTPVCALCGCSDQPTSLVFVDGLEEVLEMLDRVVPARREDLNAFGLPKSPQTDGTASTWQC